MYEQCLECEYLSDVPDSDPCTAEIREQCPAVEAEQISCNDLSGIITTDEYGLYSGGWTKKELTPESFSHPAKISRKLVHWIYNHAIAEGWLHPGDVVIDPFFGIGGVALDGMAEGAIVVGVELERHFVDMARGCDCTGITIEDFEQFKGRHVTRHDTQRNVQLQQMFDRRDMTWKCNRDLSRSFDTVEMAEWLCYYDDDIDDVFDAMVEIVEWVPGDFDSHRYEGGRHWCPRCMALVKKAEHEEKAGNHTDQVDMFSLLAPEWFTEPHHYDGNVERWARWGLPGKAIVLQGDSRELVEVLGKVDWAALGLGSPPYSTSGAANQGGQQRGGAEHLYDVEGDKYGKSPENLGNMACGSPPFATAETRDRSPTQPGSVSDAITRAYTQDKQGVDEGNLSHMPMGDMVVSSPPFGKQYSGGRIGKGGTPNQRRSPNSISPVGYQHQGTEEGNLANMKMGELDTPPEFSVLRGHVESWKEKGDLVVSSSPWTQTEASDYHLESSPGRFERMYARYKAGGGGMTRAQYRSSCEKRQGGYGNSEGQLGAMPPGDLVMGSPPFMESVAIGGDQMDKFDRLSYQPSGRGKKISVKGDITQKRRYGIEEGQLGAMPPGDLVVSSSPFAQSIGSDDPDKRGGLYRDPKRAQDVNLTGSYGDSPGQLGAMACGSPPYAGSLQPETPAQTESKQARIAKSKSIHDGRQLETDSPGKAAMGGGYGVEEGQLGSMVEGELAVSSPPFCGSELTKDKKFADAVARDKRGGSHLDTSIGSYGTEGNIAEMAEGQIDIAQANTFWSAARLILLQLYQVLKPGAHAIWVVKPFVRKKQIVDFPGQWRQLCESCGFRTLHMHTCWQIEHGAVQLDFDGNEHQETKERISFFRRLYNKKYPHNAINWEIVWCMERI